MKERLYRRSFVFIIIVFFIGASTLPSISGDMGTNSKQQIQNDSINPQFINQGLIAYWSFDEGSGTTAHDYSGNGYDGTIHGATWTSGYSGYALNFNGADSYVDLDPHSENLGYNKTDDYVISAYISTTTDETGIIYSMGSSDGLLVYANLIMNADGSITYRTGTPGCLLFVNSKAGFNNGDWYHIEVKLFGNDDNPTLELYVNDELEDSITDWLCPIVNTDFKTAKIGRRSNNETDYFYGKIDEVRIFKYPEIENLPPSKPTIEGQTKGKTGTEYDYTFTSTDPNGDKVSYYIEWGDGTIEDWFGPFNSGDPQIKGHAWSEDGTYTIRAKARDTFGAESVGWGELIVTMPRNKAVINSFLLRFLEQFPVIRQLLGL